MYILFSCPKSTEREKQNAAFRVVLFLSFFFLSFSLGGPSAFALCDDPDARQGLGVHSNARPKLSVTQLLTCSSPPCAVPLQKKKKNNRKVGYFLCFFFSLQHWRVIYLLGVINTTNSPSPPHTLSFWIFVPLSCVHIAFCFVFLFWHFEGWLDIVWAFWICNNCTFKSK